MSTLYISSMVLKPPSRVYVVKGVAVKSERDSAPAITALLLCQGKHPLKSLCFCSADQSVVDVDAVVLDPQVCGSVSDHSGVLTQQLVNDCSEPSIRPQSAATRNMISTPNVV